MNKLYLFLVLLAIVSCIKRKKQETDDSKENLDTLKELFKLDFIEFFDTLYEKAKEYNELCELNKVYVEEDKDLAEACKLIAGFVENVFEEDNNGQ